jgi:hypothetical protein
MNVIDIRALMYTKYLRLLEKHGWKYAQLCMGERRMELIGQYLNEKSLYKQSIWAMV